METELVHEFIEQQRTRGIIDLRSGYGQPLEAYAEWLKQHQIFSFYGADRDTVTRYYAALASRGYAPKTVWDKSHAIHAFYKWLLDSGRILCNPAPTPAPLRTHPLPRAVPSWCDLRKSYERLADTSHWLRERDLALIDLAYACGLRRCELHRLDIDDIDTQNCTVRVRGKGGNQRLAPIGGRALKQVLAYIHYIRPRLAKNSPTKALFVSWQGGGKRMNRYSINAIFKRLRRRDILPRSVTPHRLRHAFATDLVCNGAAVQDVSRMLGHKKLETTQIYTRLMPVDLQRHHKQHHPRA
jgi:site-specific recombinase XerD